MNAAITIYKEKVKNYIRTDIEIETLDSNCSFSEGPVWNHGGFYLFSDIPENRICRIIDGGFKETYLHASGCTIEADYLSSQPGSNGLAYDRNGVLYICQHGNGAIAKYSEGGIIETFRASPNDKPFNSPNDIVVHSDGTVYFSDPPYGLKEQQLNPGRRQSFAAFYCCRDEKVFPFCKEFKYPNGVCLSPDEKTLYCCSTKPFEKFVLVYDAQTLQLKGTLTQENSDGIKCDGHGNIYLCTGEGIVIIDNTGERLAKIELETIPANCCWGGEDGKDLLVTARQNIFLIRELLK